MIKKIFIFNLLILISFILISCKKYEKLSLTTDGYYRIFQRGKEVFDGDNTIYKGYELEIFLNNEKLDEEYKEIDSVKVNGTKYDFKSSESSIKILADKNIYIDHIEPEIYTLYTDDFFDVKINDKIIKNGKVLPKNEKIKISYKEEHKSKTKALINGKVHDLSEGFVIIDVNGMITIQNISLLQERKISSDQVILINIENTVFNEKKVLRRIFNDNFFKHVKNNIVINKQNNKYIFKKIGKNTSLYEYQYVDGTKENVLFTYDILPKVNELELKYARKFENIVESFIGIKNIDDYVKTVGYDNYYLPEVNFKILSLELDKNKKRFNKIIKNIDTSYIEGIKFSFELYEGNIKLNNEDYFTNEGLKINFKDNISSDRIFTLKLIFEKNEGKKIESYEKIKIAKGINAYEDLELRKYFREAFNYSEIYLQRDIEAFEQPNQYKVIKNEEEKPKNFDPSKDKWEEYYKTLRGTSEVKLDLEGNVIDETKFNTGAIYYRMYVRDKAMLPLKFNGNFYKISAKNFSYVREFSGVQFETPNVSVGIITIDNDFYLADNEIKNIEIEGNAGISGKTYGLKGVPLFSGGLHGIYAYKTPLKLENVTIDSCNVGLNTRQNYIDGNYVRINKSFGVNAVFANSPGLQEEIVDEPRDFEIFQLRNSELLSSGGGGMSVFDNNRRTRPDGKEDISKYDPNSNEDRQRYSVDPTIIFENTKVDTKVNIDGEIFRFFNLKPFMGGIKEYNELLKSELNISILNPSKENKEITLVNIVFLLQNGNVLEKTITDKDHPRYYMTHDEPRWDLDINGKKDYKKSDYVLGSQDLKDILYELGALATLLGETEIANYLLKNLNKKETAKKIVQTLANYFRNKLKNEYNELFFTKFIQILPAVDDIIIFGKIPGSLIIGFEEYIQPKKD